MQKQNDLILNMLDNPKFEARDFMAVGLKSDNTNLLSEEDYLRSSTIQNEKVFLDSSGNFDKNKFHEFYETASLIYNQMAQQSYSKLLLNDAQYSQDNIWVEPYRRKKSLMPKMVRLPNETLVTSSLESVGKRGKRNRSLSEIAQTQQVYNVETGKWEDSPNDAFWGHLTDTLVLATYDEDEYDDDGNLIHHKGDQKYNDDDLPYYETLGGRNPHDKLVLNKMNTFTKDGSTLNRFDFFDSDDIEQKSLGGSILKNAALVGSMFIPYVGPYVIAASVLTLLAGLGATFGKIIAGSDSPTLNNIQGWAKSVGRNTKTEYAQKNTWCLENFIDMVGDTVGQLAEQRWIFKATPYLTTGSSQTFRAMSGKKGRAAVEAEILKEMDKTGSKVTMENVVKSMESGTPLKGELLNKIAQMRELNNILAANRVDDLIKNATGLGSPLSKLYMTGITVQDSYEEAKAAGASDVEAAFLTLGYAGAEYALLSTGLGEWIMPELHAERLKHTAIGNALVKGVIEEAKQASTGKKDLASRLIKAGSDIFHNRYAAKAMSGVKGLDVIGAHALGESFEEVSEEVLSDVSKSMFNASRWLRGEDGLDMGQWDNMLDRYGMSALGGLFGGAINSAATDFSVARNLSKMDRTQALQELTYIINEGKEGEFLKNIEKMQLGSRDLSERRVLEGDNKDQVLYEEAKDERDSLDFQLKRLVTSQVNLIKHILETEGAKVSQSSLINTLSLNDLKTVLKDLKLVNLSNTSVLGLYLLGYQSLLADIVTTKAKLIELDKATDLKDDEDIKAEKARLNQKLLQLRIEKDAYLSGKKSGEFVRDALFESNPILNQFAIKANENTFLRWKYGRDVDDLSEAEKEEGMKAYEEYQNSSMKNDVHDAAQAFWDMLINASPRIQQQFETYKVNKELEDIAHQTNKFIGEILYGDDMQSILESAVIDPDQALIKVNQVLGSVNNYTLGSIGHEMFSKEEVAELDRLMTVYNATAIPVEKLAAKARFDNYLVDLVYNKFDSIIAPFVNRTYMGPELKQSLGKSLDYFIQVYNDRQADLEEDIRDAYEDGDEDRANELKLESKEIQRRLKELRKYRLDIDNMTNTPILEFLAHYQRDVLNTDSDIMKHWKDTMKVFQDAGEDMSEVIISDTWKENNEEVLKIIESYKAVLNGLRTDNADFDNPFGYSTIINKVNKKIGNQDAGEAAEIDKEFTDIILQDVINIENRLSLAGDLSDINRGQILKQLDRVASRKNFLLYKQLSNLSDVVPPDDWDKEEVEKLLSVINDASFLKENLNAESLQFSKEQKLQAEQEMLKIEDALYNFFNSEKHLVNGELDKEKVGRLIQAIAGDAGFYSENGELLTENSTFIDHNAFIWWLAAHAALKGSKFYSYQLKANDEEKAAIASQELATYLGVAAITNMNVLNTFVDAYQDTIVKSFKEKSVEDRKSVMRKGALAAGDEAYAESMLEYFAGSNYVPQYRNMIFIEGAPGTGKTNGVLHNIRRIIDKINPTYLEGLWYAHATEDSAKEAVGKLGFKNAHGYSKDQLLKMISDKYIKADYLDYLNEETGKTTKELTLNPNTYKFKDGKVVNTLPLNKYSSNDLPKVIFIDEVSHYNEQELSMIEQFARENGIVVITAGDLDQDTPEVKVQNKNAKGEVIKGSVSISRNKFIRAPKLGVSLRGRNKNMEENLAMTRIAMKRVNGNMVSLDYKYIDNLKDAPGLFGVKVIRSHSNNNIEGTPLEDAKKSVDLMVNTLKDGQFLNYIYDDSTLESALKKYVEEKYKDKVKFFKGSEAQGREGQYYVVENDRATDINPMKYLRSLYTGISRAEQGALVITNDALFGQNINDVRSHTTKDLQVLNIGPEEIRQNALRRKEQLETLLPNYAEERLEILPPTIHNNDDVEVSEATPPKLPPALPEPPRVPRRTDKGWTDKMTLVHIMERLGLEGVKVKQNDTDEIFTVKDIQIISDVNLSIGREVYRPVLTLESEDGRSIPVNYDDFRSKFSAYKDENLIPLYTVGDSMTVEIGGEAKNVTVVNIDMTDPHDPEYTIRSDKNEEWKYKQNELLQIYRGVFVPPVVVPLTEVAVQTGLENLSEDEYEEMVAQENLSESPRPVVEGEHINHILYTFDTFETGMDRDPRERVVGPLPPKYYDARQERAAEQRIDGMIGLHKMKPRATYDELNNLLGLLYNELGSETDNATLADNLGRLLGLTGKLKVRYGIYSTAGEQDYSKDPRFNRFYRSQQEILSYILDPNNEKLGAWKNRKIVAVLLQDGKNVLELAVGRLNSPFTLTNVEVENLPIYDDVRAIITNNVRNHIPTFQTVNEIIDKFSGTHKELTDLFKLFAFTENNITWLNDDFNLAKHESTGPILSLDKGLNQYDYQILDKETWLTRRKFRDIREFVKNPRHHVSSVMMVKDNNVNGITVPKLKPGHTFVLVSDNNQFDTDEKLVQQFAKEATGVAKTHHVNLFYVTPPRGKVSDWLVNTRRLYTNKLPAGHPDATSEEVYDIGNDFTAYQILRALIENNKLDNFTSANSLSKDDVKRAVQELKDIEAKWAQEDVTLDKTKMIEGRSEVDYFNYLIAQGYSKKAAYDILRIREQKNYLDSKKDWDSYGIKNGRTIKQGLTQYLMNIPWALGVQHNLLNSEADINRLVKEIEDAVSDKLPGIYYKAQYSNDSIAGNFIKVKTNGDYTFGKRVDGEDAYFKINAKIDTPFYVLPEISSIIGEMADHIYFDETQQRWRMDNAFKWENQKSYLGESTAAVQTVGDLVVSKYNKYKKYFNKDILNNDALSEHDMLIALAADINSQDKPLYAFVRNNLLYVVNNAEMMKNLPADMEGKDSITLKNVPIKDKLVDVTYQFNFNPDGSLRDITGNYTQYSDISGGSNTYLDLITEFEPFNEAVLMVKDLDIMGMFLMLYGDFVPKHDSLEAFKGFNPPDYDGFLEDTLIGEFERLKNNPDNNPETIDKAIEIAKLLIQAQRISTPITIAVGDLIESRISGNDYYVTRVEGSHVFYAEMDDALNPIPTTEQEVANLDDYKKIDGCNNFTWTII